MLGAAHVRGVAEAHLFDRLPAHLELWVADGDAYVWQTRGPVQIVNDGLDEEDETTERADTDPAIESVMRNHLTPKTVFAMVSIIALTAALGPPGIAVAQDTAGTRIVDERAATVRFSSGSYTLDERAGATTAEISLIARTPPHTRPPLRGFSVTVSTRDRTAVSGDDYRSFSRRITFGGGLGGDWVADGSAYVSEVRVPVSITDDRLDEGREKFGLLLQRVASLGPQIGIIPADLTAPRCTSLGCESTVTIIDDDTRGVATSQTGTLLVDEAGTAAYTVVLDSRPTDDVTVTPGVQDGADAEISVSPALTFGPRTWNVPQTMTVTAGADDNTVDGSATITHTVSGGDYGDNAVTAPSIPVVEQDREADQGCTPADCDNTTTSIDDDLDTSEDTDDSGPVVVTLVRVPDGTVIADNSTVFEGATVHDGSTFEEGERVWFRILLSAADGGPAPGGADVELSFDWHHNSPLVPISGEISRVVFGLPRADVWDTTVQILDNEIANPDSTVTVTITGCERNGCEIGSPSEITLTITDDDGGATAASQNGR